MKPLPTKGYVRADFVIEQSAFDPQVRYLRLHSRAYVSAYIKGGYGSKVVFCRWIRRNTDHDQRAKLISMLSYAEPGCHLEVRLWPAAFPRIYGLLVWPNSQQVAA